MNRPGHRSTVGLVLAGWLAAVAASSAASFAIAIGQGLGALVGGCDWIGITTPVDRQPWALVNQPSIAYASQNISILYWLGGLAAALALVLLILPLAPRPKEIVWELAALQASWMIAVVGLGWYPLVDLWDGHVSRYLILRQLPVALVWLIPVVGAWCALLPVARILAIARGFDKNLSRAGRLWTVLLHLAAPAIVWITAACWMRSRLFELSSKGSYDLAPILSPVWLPAVGASLPILAALLLAWFAYPKPFVRASHEGALGAAVLFGLISATLLLAQWFTGGPAPENMRRGIVWSAPDSRNNIRAWISVPYTETGRSDEVPTEPQ